jgi:hypothetical protein
MLSELEKLQAENKALLDCCSHLAALREPRLDKHITLLRQKLSEISRQRKPKIDRLEELCSHMVNILKQLRVENPQICIDRYSSKDWEAYVDGFENEITFVGVGFGESSFQAVVHLLERVKSYASRCKNGAVKRGIPNP